jgi:hypothetical protein
MPSATIFRLRTRPERLRSDQAETLRQALLPFAAGELAPHVRSLMGHISRQTAARNKWTFVMLSPDQNAAVVNYLANNSTRPIIAMRLWALCFRYLDMDTGEIMLTRDQFATSLSQEPDTISRIMSELVRFGAISRRRERIAGMRGQGAVRFFMNPRVATHLSGAERDEAQTAAPLLRLVTNNPA